MSRVHDDDFPHEPCNHITLSSQEMCKMEDKYGFTEDQIKQFLDTFSVFDRNCDGEITTNKLSNVMRALGHRASLQELEALIAGVDTDHSGTIDFNEFLQMMARKVSVNPETELKEVFTVFDINRDGYISGDELFEILSRLGETITKEEVEGMIGEADTNKDGLVDFTEFKAILSGK